MSAHNHTRFRNSGESWSECPTTCPLAPHGPGKCVSVEDANRVLAQERAGVQALIADAEKRAAAQALRDAAEEWLAPGRPHRPVRYWLLDRADALDPS